MTMAHARLRTSPRVVPGNRDRYREFLVALSDREEI
jgi:hypothetical protein